MVKDKNFMVVAYDVSNSKRRRKIAEILSNYGTRINYSVFECYVSQKQARELQKELRQIINKKQDSILYYHLCRNCMDKVSYTGNVDHRKDAVTDL